MTMDVNREIHAMLDVDVPNYGGKFFLSFNQKKKAKLTVGLDYINEHRIGTHRDLTINIMNPMGVQVNEIISPLLKFSQIVIIEDWDCLRLKNCILEINWMP